MPFGFKRSKSSGNPAQYPDEKKSVTTSVAPSIAPSVAQNGQESEAGLPTYAQVDPLPQATVEELNAAFTNLQLDEFPSRFPKEATCLAHLKLLEAFFVLKEDIGFTDGIFDLWDSRAPGSEESVAGDTQAQKTRDEALAKIREKRWALYVARAVDRFATWWESVLVPREQGRQLRQSMMSSPEHGRFPAAGRPQVWTVEELPPLDVLMVWHSFMLNPRNYLEDCMRYQLKDLWTTGMPWPTVDAVIDNHFNYTVPEAGQERFTSMTKRAWDNLQDHMVKIVKCPCCLSFISIPWTTCGMPRDDRSQPNPGVTGFGYGEKDLSKYCSQCGVEITHDFLRVARFKKDTEQLILGDIPMKGTIIFGTSGIPTSVPPPGRDPHEGTFPNRLIQLYLRSQILELCSTQRTMPASMMDVREIIEKAVSDPTTIKLVNQRSSSAAKGGRATRAERLAIRQMMSRYWSSHSIFGMELGGAVMRQSTFVDKMHGLDWLHSPAATNTMSRLLLKYSRFMELISLSMAVPTLDVDLAWHTHQLSPQSYFIYSLKVTRTRFVDHDDKIDETTLSNAFEWTSKTYEKTYGEVYSECSCWYCEAIRVKHVSTASKLLGGSKHDKISDEFHNSGAANMCPPDKSAHISAHNAVPDENFETNKAVFAKMQAAKQMQLTQAYDKACKRAAKKGRQPPKWERFHEDHWGYGYYGYYPYMGPYLWMTPSLYYYPLYMPMGVGVYGACAAGTCGGGVAAGACAGAGGCGGGCSGGAGGCGSSGGCGGGGAGCGGGGGGGCGGGCGG